MKYLKLVCAAVACVFIFCAYWSGLISYVNITNLKLWAQVLCSYAHSHCVSSIIIFCAVSIVAIIFSFPWAAMLSVIAGYLFGYMCMFFLIPSLTLGALGAFLIARYVLGSYVQHHWGSYLSMFNTEMERYGGWYLLVIRLMPIFPFFLVNSVVALTTISTRAYIAATFFGIIPTTLVFVCAGTQLACVSTVSDILTCRVFEVLGLLVVLALVPFLYQRFFVRR
jgi:uncharacterized membrane protein YdjX (TVP38/TMEM64 family)